MFLIVFLSFYLMLFFPIFFFNASRWIFSHWIEKEKGETLDGKCIIRIILHFTEDVIEFSV